MSSDLERAKRLYRAFREQEPRRAQRVSRSAVSALARMGPLEFMGYTTTHNGKAAIYTHHFAPGSRPILYAGPQRNQLALYGGRYTVTGRGITDLDVRGRPVDYPGRYVVIERAEYLRLTRRRRRP